MRQFWRRKYAKIIFSIGLLLNSFDLLEAFEFRAAQFIDIIEKGHTTYTLLTPLLFDVPNIFTFQLYII